VPFGSATMVFANRAPGDVVYRSCEDFDGSTIKAVVFAGCVRFNSGREAGEDLEYGILYTKSEADDVMI